jgi:hypothetical protein
VLRPRRLQWLHEAGCGLRLVWLVGETPDEPAWERAAGFFHGIGPKRTLPEDAEGRARPLLERA